MLERNNQKAVLCYRNTSHLRVDKGKIYYGDTKIPWNPSWYFDGKIEKFNSDSHFAAYNEAYVVVVDQYDAKNSTDRWQILNRAITASVWCSVEICLSKGVYLVSLDGYQHHSPSELVSSQSTYEVYKFVYEAIVKWSRSRQDSKAEDELMLNVRHFIDNSNNSSQRDIINIYNAIHKYA